MSFSSVFHLHVFFRCIFFGCVQCMLFSAVSWSWTFARCRWYGSVLHFSLQVACFAWGYWYMRWCTHVTAVSWIMPCFAWRRLSFKRGNRSARSSLVHGGAECRRGHRPHYSMLAILQSMQTSLNSLTHTHSAIHSARHVDKAPFSVIASEYRSRRRVSL